MTPKNFPARKLKRRINGEAQTVQAQLRQLIRAENKVTLSPLINLEPEGTDLAKLASLVKKPLLDAPKGQTMTEHTREEVKLEYSINNICSKKAVHIKWFTSDCLQSYHEVRTAIEECARDHYENYDGWETKWPLEITLYVDGNEAGKGKVSLEWKGKVSLEFDPVFVCE